MSLITNVADLVNPETGNTYRQDNKAKAHKIPIGALVEIDLSGQDDPENGLRLYVVEHCRDCDQTPLYSLSMFHPQKLDKMKKDFGDAKIEHEGYAFPFFGLFPMKFNGYPEDCLTVIRQPQQFDSEE